MLTWLWETALRAVALYLGRKLLGKLVDRAMVDPVADKLTATARRIWAGATGLLHLHRRSRALVLQTEPDHFEWKGQDDLLVSVRATAAIGSVVSGTGSRVISPPASL